MRIRSKLIFSLIGIMVLFLLIMTWFYPYSPFSLHKSFTYKPDQKVVQGYVKDIEEFKTFKKKVDGTTDQLRYVLETYEQDWLMSESSMKMDEQQLNLILFEVKETRQLLLDLVAQQDYTKEEKEYLIHTIQTLLTIEDSITNIKAQPMLSKGKLETQFDNLHQKFISSFFVFRSFYEVAHED
ncbi:hypothetical protein LQ226_11770 [Pontibacillus sp. HN14]|nr:hypothetical protein [Pontibacillus sp. HN14]